MILKGVFLLEKNPFLEKEVEEEEEDYVRYKPFLPSTLTESQKKRNLKGIELVRKSLEKIKPIKIRYR